MFKPEMTELKKNRLFSSVQFISILAGMILIEHQSDLVDSHFKSPQINQFAKRIKQDANAILFHLKNNEKFNIKVVDMEFKEEYEGELDRLNKLMIGLPLTELKQFIDNLYEQANELQIDTL